MHRSTFVIISGIITRILESSCGFTLSSLVVKGARKTILNNGFMFSNKCLYDKRKETTILWNSLGDATLMNHTFEQLYGELSDYEFEERQHDNSPPDLNSNQSTARLPSWLTERAESIGFRQPTLIQQRALDAILCRGEDVILHAQTGSGKTLAYLLPLLTLIDPSRAAVQALVIVPTRELGLQVSRVAKRLAAGSISGPARRKIMVMSVLQGSQNKRQRAWAWAEPPHVVIGTPIELTKMVTNGGIRYNAVRYVVVDEVDACLARQEGPGYYGMGDGNSPLHILLSRYLSPTFVDDDDITIEEDPGSLLAISASNLEAKSRIVSHGKDRQTVFVSATIPQRHHFCKQCVQNQWTVRTPTYIRASPGELIPPTLSHEYVVCASVQSKLAGLRRILRKEAKRGTIDRALIFCDPERPMEQMAATVAKDLEGLVWTPNCKPSDIRDRKFLVSVLRYEESLTDRAAAMQAFQGSFVLDNNKDLVALDEDPTYDTSRQLPRIMFSSDLAARGLDVEGISHVINFDLPDDGDKYVHRGGRAGRLGQLGTVISMIIPSQEFVLNRLSNGLGLQDQMKCTARQKTV